MAPFIAASSKSSSPMRPPTNWAGLELRCKDAAPGEEAALLDELGSRTASSRSRFSLAERFLKIDGSLFLDMFKNGYTFILNQIKGTNQNE